MDQEIIDRAVNIATRAAMNGHPVRKVWWIKPSSAADDVYGHFAIEYCGPLNTGDTPPWER